MGKIFTLDLQVRDYELDQFGVVNNSAYANYLEHARHEFMVSLGIDPAEVARAGRALALSALQIKFRSPLMSRERFRVRIVIGALTAARVTLLQDIFRLPSEELLLEARAEAVFLNERGRPMRVEPEHRKLFLPYLDEEDA